MHSRRKSKEAATIDTPITDRNAWALHVLNLEPSDHVLEIGCGRGAAVSMICERLTDGRVTAIDQSPKMIEAAQRKNARHVESGKAIFYCGSLHSVPLGGKPFNKALAVNVNLFWMDAAKELVYLKQLLQPGGSLILVNQPPSAAKIPMIEDRMRAQLLRYGYKVSDVLVQHLHPAPGVCVIGRY